MAVNCMCYFINFYTPLSFVVYLIFVLFPSRFAIYLSLPTEATSDTLNSLSFYQFIKLIRKFYILLYQLPALLSSVYMCVLASVLGKCAVYLQQLVVTGSVKWDIQRVCAFTVSVSCVCSRWCLTGLNSPRCLTSFNLLWYCFKKRNALIVVVCAGISLNEPRVPEAPWQKHCSCAQMRLVICHFILR